MANLAATISRASCFGPLGSLHGTRASYSLADTPSTAQAMISRPQRSSNNNMHTTQTRSNHCRSSTLCTANLVRSRSRQWTSFVSKCKASSRSDCSRLGTQLWGKQLRRDDFIELERPSGRKAQRPSALFGLGSEAPPEAIPLRPLKTEEDLDAALQTAEDEGHALLIDWMATWCRKCIYLLPKMEKLSGEFQDVKFYMVNVNEVPGALVKRGGIQKMPTIQLWKNKGKVGEVIGGHKAWMVMDEIREMIKNDGTSQGSSS